MSSGTGNGLTLTVLGSGTLGTAILLGILDSLHDQDQGAASESTGTTTPPRLPSKFHACVRSEASAARISSTLASHSSKVSVHTDPGSIDDALQASDVVILGVKPYMVPDVLQKHAAALRNTLLLSICAGVTVASLSTHLDPSTTAVRVMPNTPSAIAQGMTVICASEPPLPAEQTQLIEWILSRIGRVTTLPASAMDAATALAGSGPAFVALMLDALADGGVAMGIPRKEAQLIAAQTMRGTAELVLRGEHPAVLKDKVCTPGGCTIGGLMVMEEAGVRAGVSGAVRQAAVVASQLGEGGVKLVNGPRR